jgi:hypothetical protein
MSHLDNAELLSLSPSRGRGRKIHQETTSKEATIRRAKE